MSERWSRGDKIGLAGVIIALLGLIAAFAVVPEIRRGFRLDDATTDRTPVTGNSVVPVVRSDATLAALVTSTTDESSRARKQVTERTPLRLSERESDEKAAATSDDWGEHTQLVQTSNAPPYKTNFAYGMSEWAFHRFGSWSETAKWTLVDDAGLALQLAGGVQWGGGNYIAVVPQTSQTDGKVTVRIKIADVRNGGHHSGVVARFRDTDNFYELFLNRPSQSVNLSRWVAGQEHRLASVEVPAYVFEQWVTLELRCNGRQLVGLINGRKVLEATDGAHTQGAFGLFNAGGATRFQDFAVTNDTA